MTFGNQFHQGVRHESKTGIHSPNGGQRLHARRLGVGRQEVCQQQHHNPVELFPGRLGNARCDVIETIIAVFAVGFLGVAVGIGVVCLMVWMALNED